MAKKGENIYKRKDGRWEGRYIKAKQEDGRIKYGYIYRASYKEVKQELIKKKAFYKFRIYPKEMRGGTLADWLNHWLGAQHNRIRQSTHASYRNKLETHVIPFIGDMQLSQLTPQVMQEWWLELEQRLSVSSANAVVRVLKNALNEPCKKEMCPPHLFEQMASSKGGKKVEALMKSEREQIVAVAVNDSQYLPVLLALETGMRIGEISGLKWMDIDFKKRQIEVKRTLQRISVNEGPNKTCVIETPPKNRQSQRIIPISPGVVELLKRLKETQQGEYVVSKNGKFVEPRTMNYRFKKLLKQLDIQSYSFHALRHTFATNCLEQGVSIAAISSLLGHASIKMTLDVYTNSTLLEEHSAIERVTYVRV